MRVNLISERGKLELTQSQFAEKTGLTERQYRSIEKGASNGSITFWEKAKALTGQTIDYLLEQVQKKPATTGESKEKDL